MEATLVSLVQTFVCFIHIFYDFLFKFVIALHVFSVFMSVTHFVNLLFENDYRNEDYYYLHYSSYDVSVSKCKTRGSTTANISNLLYYYRERYENIC